MRRLLRRVTEIGSPSVLAGWYVPNRAQAGRRARFGTPIAWSARPDAYDLQLGLAMAALLPSALAPQWQDGLAAWRAVHA
jgi:hypothetical protein